MKIRRKKDCYSTTQPEKLSSHEREIETRRKRGSPKERKRWGNFFSDLNL
jgi:hypothetical protein